MDERAETIVRHMVPVADIFDHARAQSLTDIDLDALEKDAFWLRYYASSLERAANDMPSRSCEFRTRAGAELDRAERAMLRAIEAIKVARGKLGGTDA